MNFNLVKTSLKKKYRKGRGIAQGRGKTCGRGQKGQNARKSGHVRIGFEGGQTPLYRRIPKFGFTNIHRVPYTIIDFDLINKYYKDNEIVDKTSLLKKRIIRKNKNNPICLVNNGKLEKKVKIKVDKITKSSQEAIKSYKLK